MSPMVPSLHNCLLIIANRRFVDADLIRNGALRQSGFLQCINLVTLTLSEAVIGSHSCSFTFDGERHLGIAASRIIPWVKLHWRVESALDITEHVDHIILFSGDGDLSPVVQCLKRRGVRVTVVSTLKSQHPSISDNLRRVADHFIDLDDMRELIEKKLEPA